MTNQQPHPILIVLAFISIYIVWGSTYLFVIFALEDLPPFMMAGLRFLIAAILLFMVLPFIKAAKMPSKDQIKNSLIAGFMFLVLGNGGMSWALQYVDSGIASLMISAQPMIILFMLWALQGQKVKPQSMIGVGLGIIGIYLLVSQDEIVHGPDYWYGMLAIVSCLFTWGYASLFVGKADMPQNFFVNSALQMILAGILMIGISVGFEDVDAINWSEISDRTIYSMAFLILLGSIVAFTAFNFLLRYVSPEKVSTSTYVNPIVAMFLGWYFLDEVITSTSLVATSILLVGVYFINSNRFKRKGARARKSIV